MRTRELNCWLGRSTRLTPHQREQVKAPFRIWLAVTW